MICENCKYCERIRGEYAIRYSYHCQHPNRQHINDYFRANGLHYMEGFLGFSKSAHHLELSRKTSPRWCPLRIEDNSKGE